MNAPAPASRSFILPAIVLAVSACSRSDQRVAPTGSGAGATTVNAAHVEGHETLLSFDALLREGMGREGMGPELFRTEVTVEGTTLHKSPAFSKDACAQLIISTSAPDLEVVLEGPGLRTRASARGGATHMPEDGTVCAVAAESLVFQLRGRGVVRIVAVAR